MAGMNQGTVGALFARYASMQENINSLTRDLVAIEGVNGTEFTKSMIKREIENKKRGLEDFSNAYASIDPRFGVL